MHEAHRAEITEIERRDVGAEAFGRRHHDRIDQAHLEGGVTLDEGPRSGQIARCGPFNREGALVDIGEPRAFGGGAQLARDQIVDFGQDGPRQHPLVGIVGEERAHVRVMLIVFVEQRDDGARVSDDHEPSGVCDGDSRAHRTLPGAPPRVR